MRPKLTGAPVVGSNPTCAPRTRPFPVRGAGGTAEADQYAASPPANGVRLTEALRQLRLSRHRSSRWPAASSYHSGNPCGPVADEADPAACADTAVIGSNAAASTATDTARDARPVIPRHHRRDVCMSITSPALRSQLLSRCDKGSARQVRLVAKRRVRPNGREGRGKGPVRVPGSYGLHARSQCGGCPCLVQYKSRTLFEGHGGCGTQGPAG